MTCDTIVVVYVVYSHYVRIRAVNFSVKRMHDSDIATSRHNCGKSASYPTKSCSTCALCMSRMSLLVPNSIGQLTILFTTGVLVCVC